MLNKNRLPFLNPDKQLLTATEREDALIRRFRGEPLPEPCEASPEMADLILCVCAYNPDMRFYTATEMKQALIGVSNGTYQMDDHATEKTDTFFKPSYTLDRTTSIFEELPTDNELTMQTTIEGLNTIYAKKRYRYKMIAAFAILIAVLLTGTMFILTRMQFVAGEREESFENTSGSENEDGQEKQKYLMIDTSGTMSEMTSALAYKTTTNLNVRSEPSTSGRRLGVFEPGTEVTYLGDYDETWEIIDYEGTWAYVAKAYLAQE